MNVIVWEVASRERQLSPQLSFEAKTHVSACSRLFALVRGWADYSAQGDEVDPADSVATSGA